MDGISDLLDTVMTVNRIFGKAVFLVAAVFSGAASHLAAYPGEPTSWGTWIGYEDSRFHPDQISACTDPDGRLRALFVDTSRFIYYTQNSVPNQVHHAVLQSFRPLPNGTVLNEHVDATLGDFESLVGRDDDVSHAAAQEPRRTSVYCVEGKPGTYVYGGSYRHKLATDNFGETFFPSNSYHGNFIPAGGREPLKSLYDFFRYGFGGSEGNMLAALSAPGSTQNRIFLRNRMAGDVRLLYYEDETTPSRSFSLNLSDSLGIPNWAADRTVTGGSLAVSKDRRDFYAFVTTRKDTGGGAFTLEARLWHVRPANTTSLDGDGDTIIDIDSIQSQVIATSNQPAGNLSALTYPQILLASTGEPKWLIYTDRYGAGNLSLVRFVKRIPVTVFSNQESNLRSISQGYGAPGSSFYSSANGGSAGLDRLDRLHLAFQYIFQTNAPKLCYARENAAGNMEAMPIFSGGCTGAPALAVGPGDYPYIVYKGYAPESASFQKLVVLYPPGLRSAYKDDNEDQDKDGRLGLLEFAQGTSDTVRNTQASPIGPVPSISITSGTGEKKPRLGYQLNSSSVNISGDLFRITQGSDTIDIRLARSTNLTTWTTGGFIKKDEFTVNGRKFVEIEDPVILGPAKPKTFYRLEVTRFPGPP